MAACRVLGAAASTRRRISAPAAALIRPRSRAIEKAWRERAALTNDAAARIERRLLLSAGRAAHRSAWPSPAVSSSYHNLAARQGAFVAIGDQRTRAVGCWRSDDAENEGYWHYSQNLLRRGAGRAAVGGARGGHRARGAVVICALSAQNAVSNTREEIFDFALPRAMTAVASRQSCLRGSQKSGAYAPPLRE